MKFLYNKILATVLLLAILTVFTKVNGQQLGDNLGAHVATEALDMNAKIVYNSAGIVIGSANLANNTSVSLQIDGNKSILLPRISSFASIVTPINGMVVYLNADNKFYVYQAGAWVTFATVSLTNGSIYIGNAAGIAEPVKTTGDVNLSNSGVASITPAAVTTAKINNLAVTSAKIEDKSLLSADFASGAITTVLIADQAVTANKIDAAAISNNKIAASAVSTEHFSKGTQGANKLLITNDVGVHEWVNLTRARVPTLTTTQTIVANAAGLPTGVAFSGDVTMTNAGVTTIKNNGVTSSHILDGTIVAADLANSSVTAPKISSTTAGNYKVMTTNNNGGAEWADQALVQGFVVGDIKPYFPGLMGTVLPTNWVRCSGQIITTTGSPLINKTVPNLNSSTFLVGSTAASGVAVGSNALTITQANLPPVIPNVTGITATAIVPTGVVAIDSAGKHTHDIYDPGHSHQISWDGDRYGDKYTRVKTTDRSSYGDLNVNSAKTNITINNGGIHNHPATFSNGNILGSHDHPGVTSTSINGGVSQTTIANIPSSITVWWIIKVL